MTKPRINTSVPHCPKCEHYRENISHAEAYADISYLGKLEVKLLKDLIFPHFCMRGKKLINNPESHDFCFLYASIKHKTDRASQFS